MHNRTALPAIWEIPDDLWQIIEEVLPPRKPSHTRGRPQLCFRRVLTAITYVLSTGCQWKQLRWEGGSSSSVHRYFQQWVKQGVFEQLWVKLLEFYDSEVGIKWRWLSADGTMVKSPLGGTETGASPTDRGKLGTKRHIVVDGRGVALSVEVASANTPDMRLLELALDSIVIERPDPRQTQAQQMQLDKG